MKENWDVEWLILKCEIVDKVVKYCVRNYLG